MKEKMLYSQVTKIAYEIEQDYYGGIHYVWCCDMPTYGPSQPPTSDPIERCQRIISAIYSNDRHEALIEENKKSIRNGALYKCRDKVISNAQRKEITVKIKGAKIRDFSPLLLIIDYEKVRTRLIPVDPSDKASDISEEYKIIDLRNDEFDIVDFEKAINLDKLMKGK